ncbi:MAG: hypothetical protein HY819_18270 [Acidobacteria bacterium]|nr:hypothetical protein [Acidobacteriota bacterium]
MEIENQKTLTFSITLPARLQQLLVNALEAFEQIDPSLVARPMGVDIESCKIAYSIGTKLLKEQKLTLSELEVKALIFLLVFAERELCTEIHLQMQDLQKKMASIVISRNAKEIDILAGELPKEAEKAMRGLKSVLKNRGELLNECQNFIKKLKKLI